MTDLNRTPDLTTLAEDKAWSDYERGRTQRDEAYGDWCAAQGLDHEDVESAVRYEQVCAIGGPEEWYFFWAERGHAS